MSIIKRNYFAKNIELKEIMVYYNVRKGDIKVG